jgi:CRP-like cAMP-binding protein
MGEVDPASLAERVLRLRRSHPFDAFDAGDLAVLAAAGREVVCRGRTHLVAEGERASAHWVALTGRLRGLYHGEPLTGDPFEAGFGGLSILTELPLPCDLVAEPGTVLFVLDQDTLLEALEQRGHLARTALRAMARSVLAVRRGEGNLLPSAVTMPRWLESRTLDLVSRMTALRSAVGMPAVNAMLLTSLARAAQVEMLPPGRSLWPDPTAPADLVIVLDGGLDSRPDDERGPRAGRGALYGLMESVASLPRDPPVVTTVESTAMVISHGEIQEALDDDDRICLALMRLAAVELWNAFWRRHPLLGGLSAASSREVA